MRDVLCGDRVRTTLAIDDDVLAAAKELSAKQKTSIGAVISSLARMGLRPADSGQKMRNGILLLPLRPEVSRVTSELVKQLSEELL